MDLFGSLLCIISWWFKNESKIPNDFVFSLMTEMLTWFQSGGFFSTLQWFSTVKCLSFVNQMIRHLFQHSNTPWLSLNPCAFFHFHVFSFLLYYVLKRSTLQLYCLDWVSCVCLSLSVISVSATEVDGYSKTAGAWIFSLNRNLYSVNNAVECAARCDSEVAFTCRCSPLFALTICIHTK